ncbi:hypothetical protein Alg130_09530 [Pyrenophora tritici-repentis]|uniref:Uncharacterized protein n=1 Tax=Pyrenophora tritici-repentis TaxID=45151 RepID=A0A834S5U1_9PLEO|nr:hypothetical protein PtrM4_006860 [Pyrenophora tritici-repentis]KAI0574812.1 hypothetical protein Alg130_09530 [Pyrenophora tritici-repentis]KAI0577909.1 hypothetical protein Alg215_06668 [Pyrenophora tritici-repentis]KAI0606233.1 hypothetical protein TUN205_09521 [Pyrenophora tritici-repentis]
MRFHLLALVVAPLAYANTDGGCQSSDEVKCSNRWGYQHPSTNYCDGHVSSSWTTTSHSLFLHKLFTCFAT